MSVSATRRLSWLALAALLASATSGCALLVQVSAEMASEAGRATPAETPSTSIDGTCAEIQLLPEAGSTTVSPDVKEAARRVLEARVDATGVVAAAVGAEGSDRLALSLPGIVAGSETGTALRDIVLERGVVELLPVPAGYQGQVVAGPLPAAMIDATPLLDGAAIETASASIDPTTGNPILDLALTQEGARLFDGFASAHVGEQIALVVDDSVILAPTLNAASFEGQIQISGDVTVDQLARLVAIIRSGPLPLEVREVAWAACH